MNDATRLLEAIQGGDAKAAGELLPLVYTELRRLATHKMSNERQGHTLQPTALVHEAYLHLVGNPDRKWHGRTHFFATAAEAMRRILIDSARRKKAARRGGGQQHVDLNEIEVAAPTEDDELLAMNEALDRFAAEDNEKAELVKLRYFVGLTTAEAAELLGISIPTADRWWAYARAWLYREMEPQRE